MSKKLIQAAAGAGGESVYVEDVFSTYLYEGNGSSITVNNGIDLSGEGGVVWTKSRTDTNLHYLQSSETTGYLSSNNTNAIAGSNYISFGSNGYTFPYDFAGWNGSGRDYVSWSFRKQAGFFDVVTYTGNGTAGRTVSHNLGSTPAVMIIKNITTNGRNWAIYHESLGNTKALDFTTGAAFTWTAWNSTSPTDSEFTVGADAEVNANGESFVAYLFAHDDQSFGDDSDESIIKCGSFSGDVNADINLGWEPQFLIYKRTDTTGSWGIFDVMRGMTADGSGTYLLADSSAAEATASGQPSPISNGFRWNSTGSGSNYIYIAIRRPMKTPESGTEVFTPNAYTGDGATRVLTSSNDPVDLGIVRGRGGSADWIWSDRLRGATKTIYSNYTSAEGTQSTYITGFDVQNGMEVGTGTGVNGSGSTYISYMLSRATGFFDMVAYTGNGINNRAISHNLKAEPTLIITKKRSGAYDWIVYAKDNSVGPQAHAILNGTPAFGWYSGQYRSPYATSSVYYIGSDSAINASGTTYIAYLFATLAGVSKVGSYTGTGSDQNIDCGFSGSPRFLMIKRTDSAGDWYVWDSARGIVAGNDPRLQINSGSGGETTSQDWIDPYASGFTLVGGNQPNISGGGYIFLAIA